MDGIRVLGFHGPQQDMEHVEHVEHVEDVEDVEVEHLHQRQLLLLLLSYQDDGVVRQQQIEEDLHAREWGHLEQQ